MEKNRGLNDISAGKEKLKNHAAVYTFKQYQISTTEETSLHVVRLTQPFQSRSLRRWANFSSAGKLRFQPFQWPFTGYSALLKAEPCSLVSTNRQKSLPVGLQISLSFFIKINKPPTSNLCPRGFFL